MPAVFVEMQPKATAESGWDKSPLSTQTQTKPLATEEPDVGLRLLKKHIGRETDPCTALLWQEY